MRGVQLLHELSSGYLTSGPKPYLTEFTVFARRVGYVHACTLSHANLHPQGPITEECQRRTKSAIKKIGILRHFWHPGCDCSEKRDPAKSDLYARAATARLKWRLSIALGLKDKGADVKREFEAFLISGAVAHWLALLTIWKACAEALA